jgi:serine/threonine protein kinase
MSELPNPDVTYNQELPPDSLDAGLAIAFGKDFLGTSEKPPDADGADPLVEKGQLGDFRIHRAIGRGGMGIVYEAEQVSLGRRVALKVLPFASTLDAKQLQRFKNEAQAAAALHHTNIVPVYATGCERGVHFYAMQFIEGCTLAAAIEQLRKQAQRGQAAKGMQITPWSEGPQVQAVDRSPSDASLATASSRPYSGEASNPTTPQLGFSTDASTKSPAFFRAAANVGIQAAQGLEHAHQLGVVHRDIKPANLLLDGRGNLWITDFGLAQVRSNASLTLTGDLLGTVRYMSPEQTLAKRVLLDHRTDVYSLGVTLYELLTLEAAFTGRNRHEVVHQIAFEEPRRPRLTNKAVPAELEMIVMKAMEKIPAERYATAQEMADDLQRFLKDEPIRAKRPGLVLRARKWTRRHSAISWSALLLVFLAMAAVAMFSWREKHWADRRLADKGQEQQKTQAALDQAEKARRRARLALDELCSEEVLGDWLGRRTQLTGTQRDFLERALESYEKFTEEIGDSPEQRQALAGAYYHVAVIRTRLGQETEAEVAYRRAIDLLDRLVREFPDVGAYAQDLARYHNDLAICQGAMGQTEEAIQSLENSRVQQAALVRAHPGAAQFARDLARTYVKLGVQQARRGDTQAAVASEKAAIELLGELVRDQPKRPGYRFDLSTAYQNLGVDLARLNRTDEALASYQIALNLQSALGHEDLRNRDLQVEMARTYFSLGELQRRMGRSDAALESQEKSRAMRAALAREYPSFPAYTEVLAQSHNNLGILLGELGRLDEALQSYEAALAIDAALVRDHPDVPRFAEGLGGVYCNLAALVRRTKGPEAALKVFDEAISTLQAALKKEPSLYLAKEFLRNSHMERLTTLQQLGRGAEVIEEREHLVADFPGVLEYALNLAGEYCNFGRAISEQGKPAEALAWFARAIETLGAVLEKDEPSGTARQFLRNSYWSRAVALNHLDRFAAAVNDWDKALEFDDGPADAEIRMLRGHSLLLAGEPAKAVADAEAVAALKVADAATLYDVACIVSLAAVAVKHDASLMERYAARAVELLGKAETAAFFADAEHIELVMKDPDLDCLRGRDDFKKLLAQLTAEGVN